jgi:hypothetical protein
MLRCVCNIVDCYFVLYKVCPLGSIVASKLLDGASPHAVCSRLPVKMFGHII